MKTTMLGIGNQFDTNVTNPAIAINAQNQVLCLSTDLVNNLYYKIGNVSGMVINWGSTHSFTSGANPAVALNNQGQYVEVHRTSNIFGSSLWWSTGTINTSNNTLNPNSAYEEDSLWGNSSPSITLSNVGVVAAAFQSDSSTTTCKVGKIESGQLVLINTSTFTGTTPAIAFNPDGGLIVVYFNSQMILCYRLGQLQNDNTTMSWGNECTVGQTPLGTSSFNATVTLSVAYTSDAIIIVYPGGDYLTSITANWEPGTISWGKPMSFDEGITPRVAANDQLAVAVHQSQYYTNLYYTVCLIADHARWIGNLLPQIGSKTLGEVVFPATHDAGMWASGTLPESRTQDASIFYQLMGGIRYFDLRPKYDSDDDAYYTYHGPSTGESITDVLADVANFMANQQSNELVILKFSHFKNFGDDSKSNSTYTTFISQVKNALNGYLLGVDHSTKLGTLTMNQMVGHSGKVIVVCSDNYPLHNSTSGIYVYRDGDLTCNQEARTNDPRQGNLVVWDCYSNSTSSSEMEADQLAEFAAYNGYCSGAYTTTPCDMFLLSWTLTPWLNSVWDDSINPARDLGPSLNSLQANEYGKIPNLLYVNYFEYTRAPDIAILMNQQIPIASTN